MVPNNVSGPVEGWNDLFGAFIFTLAIGPYIVIALIIFACFLGVAICVGLVFCLIWYSRSENHEETQVEPISIVTDYGHPESISPSLKDRKSTPTPKS